VTIEDTFFCELIGDYVSIPDTLSSPLPRLRSDPRAMIFEDFSFDFELCSSSTLSTFDLVAVQEYPSTLSTFDFVAVQEYLPILFEFLKRFI
jgi:hypothetical protein